MKSIPSSLWSFFFSFFLSASMRFICKQRNRDSCRRQSIDAKQGEMPVPLTTVPKEQSEEVLLERREEKDCTGWNVLHECTFSVSLEQNVCDSSVCVMRRIAFPASISISYKTPHCICHQLGQDSSSSSSHLVSGCPSAEGCNSETTLHSYKWHHSLWLYNALGGSLFLWAFTA